MDSEKTVGYTVFLFHTRHRRFETAGVEPALDCSRNLCEMYHYTTGHNT